jgi:uncharacterized protein (DUF58 family)
MRPAAIIRNWSRNWIRQRQGPDRGSVELHRRRIYILPTGLGMAFGVMLFAMLLGSLNYGNNLGLGLTFLLAALGVVAMHACHRNLTGLSVASAGTQPPFAGQDAGFRLSLSNPSLLPRIDIEASTLAGRREVVTVGPSEDALVHLAVPTRRRGRVRLDRCEIATRYPLGLFRAWAVLHPEDDCLVYPRPALEAPLPPRAPGVAGAGTDARGDDDFAGLKDYHPGDSPRRIAWKAHARGGELLVKEFAGMVAPAMLFDLEQAPGADLEQRLSVLARWILDAQGRDEAFGLRLPGLQIEPEPGESQRRRCLAALAEFEQPGHRDE